MIHKKVKPFSLYVLCIFLIQCFFSYATSVRSTHTKQGKYMTRHTLPNGMTVLVRQVNTIPKATTVLWYNVGSKDEATGQKGIAHLIEHMWFKGTKEPVIQNGIQSDTESKNISHRSASKIDIQKKALSESDINQIVYKLSGECNAFTGHDYTGYIFTFPTQHYSIAFEIMSDCMENCVFNDQMLNSEMKAVIQELKMYRDNYISDAVEKLISMLFTDHPYHYPIIGFKKDLWTVSGQDLKAFYKKHYHPGNATLVVVGDVDPDEVIQYAYTYFGSLQPDPTYQKEQCSIAKDISIKKLTLFRDIQQPIYIYASLIPGLKEKQDYVSHIAEWIIGKGRGSVLYKALINQQYVTSLDMGSYDLFDQGILFIECEPVDGISQEQIKEIIAQELQKIAREGITDAQLQRAVNKVKSGFYSVLESTEDQADLIGKYFLATGDENYLFESMDIPFAELKKRVEQFLQIYLRPSLMHEAAVLPIGDEERRLWQTLQEESDKEDERILAARVRTLPVQAPERAHEIHPKEPTTFAYIKPEMYSLPNGLKVMHAVNKTIPKIAIVISFKAQYFYDPSDKQGLYNFVTAMIPEGTKQYTADELAEYTESKGMSFSCVPGSLLLTVLKEDLAEGLAIVRELVDRATFPEKEVEKVRVQLLNDVRSYWDDPRSFSNQLVKDIIYKNHPYQKNILGNEHSIKSITQKELIECYKHCFVPGGTTIAIVGDTTGYDIRSLVTQYFSDWTGEAPEKPLCSSLQSDLPASKNHFINRDQVVLIYACPSIKRDDPDYDKLLIFDQIFGGGFLRSMNSRLFELREQTGLFYTINGTFLAGADEEQGMFQVKTIVSLDRLKEAETAITGVIRSAVELITDKELLEAKRAIINSMVDNFSSNVNIARTFLYINKFNLPLTYFDNRHAQLDAITKEDIQQAIQRVLNEHKFAVVRVGRVK